VNTKNFLPILVLLTLFASGFFQPEFVTSIRASDNQNHLLPTEIITVCSGVGICDYESIQEAIDNASADDTIQLAGETFTESITVDVNVSIVGIGPQDTIIQAAENLSAATSRVITVTNGITAQLEGIAIQFGSTNGDGGGILNQGNLTIDNVLITHNDADSGGGIANISGQITMANTTIAFNASTQLGGGIANYASFGDAIIEISNTTISLNTAEGGGGGVYNEAISGTANLNIQQTTINENSASSGSNLLINSGQVAIGQSILANSIISGNDCTRDGGTITDLGHNLIEDGSCGFPVAGDPKLIFLANNGGDTPTNALQSDSPALDQVPAQECFSLSDQRGETRPFGAGCDIGAFELHEQSLNFSLQASTPSNFVAPGELITFTMIVEPIGPGISNGTISGEMSEEFAVLGGLTLHPPNTGIVGSGPPILAYSMTISATQAATLTMPTQIELGLSAGTELYNQVSFTSNEVITPVVTSASFTIKNVPPIAVDDSGIDYTTTPNQPFTTGNVLDNDYDPNGDVILYWGSSPGDLLGSIHDNHDGTFDYDPGFAFEDLPAQGIAYDQFNYSITDGVGGIVQGTVTITIINPELSIFLPLVLK